MLSMHKERVNCEPATEKNSIARLDLRYTLWVFCVSWGCRFFAGHTDFYHIITTIIVLVLGIHWFTNLKIQCQAKQIGLNQPTNTIKHLKSYQQTTSIREFLTKIYDWRHSIATNRWVMAVAWELGQQNNGPTTALKHGTSNKICDWT